ncbi:MAG: adenosylcobinamide-phosphate synthase CbiB [Fusobacteriaceae bacterium]
MKFIIIYFIAYILDLCVGDPNYFFHPIRLIGVLIQNCEKVLYKIKNKKIGGLLLTFVVVVVTFVISYSLVRVSIILEIFLIYTTLATRCLGNEGQKVFNILKKGDMEKARKEIGYLVSRDTNQMDENQIIRSTIETISENLVDGVIAPMCFAFLGSFFYIKGYSLALPFAMAYKAINTLDSMVGYKNEKYLNFGMFSAKVDDFVNLIPARLTGGFIIPISSMVLGLHWKNSWKIYFRDRLKHSSPNSGNPEAAFAGALGLQFGGKTSYFGQVQNKPTIGDKIKEFDIEDIKKSCKLLYVSSFIGLFLLVILRVLI